MASLLDSLLYGSQGGYGGLLNGLMYQSPLTEKKPLITPSFGPNGEFDFYNAYKPDPFGAVPQFKPPSQFDVGTAATPFTQFGSNPQPQAPVPELPPAQTIVPAPRVAPLPPQNYAPPQASTDLSSQNRQQQQPQQPLPPALGGPQGGGGGFLDNLSAGFQSLGNGGSILGALSGNLTDPQSIAQRNLKSEYDALVPVLGRQNALLAVMNKDAGKVLLSEALSDKQKFGVISEDNGVRQYGFTNDRDQTVTPYTPKGSETPGIITGPDGKPIQIPPGVDRKTFVNEISRANAKAAAGEKTEVQAKAEIFANKMELAEKTIKSLEGEGTSLTGKVAGGVPIVGNYAQSPKYQKYKQASSNFITALLRQESGAAISKSEFERYDKEYMPQPGDSAQVLAQKAETRRVAIEGMKKGAGPGYKSPTDTGTSMSGKTKSGVSWSVQ